MPQKTLADGQLRITYPPTHRATRDAGDDRELDGGPVHATLVQSLRDTGFDTVEEFRLTPTAPRGLDPKHRTAPGGKLAMTLDLTGEREAVVLVEKDGCYSWHLPLDHGRGRTRRLPGELRTATFDIPLAWAPARTPEGQPVQPRATTTRGLFGDLLSGAVRVVVMRFAAPFLAKEAISFLERSVQPGIVHLASPDPSTWTRVDRLEQVPLPHDRPARILLFVHGTFSSTLGAFGALGVTDAGRDFLQCALAAYDAVVGFDHPTLSVDPLANATDLLERVRSVAGPVTFDVICHSRGGLTTRSFVEHVLPGSGWGGAVDRIVFVAATNGGTNLADPDRWNDLVDITTNLTAVSAGVLAGLPGGLPVAALVGSVVKGLGAFVKYLGAYAVGQGGVPGLAAMAPSGPFVTDLNHTQPGQPGPGTSWYVVSSSFHVTLLDDSHHPPEFPRELVVRLAEGLVDQVFKGDNDLVVDDASMSAIDPAAGDFVADELCFGTNDVVYHLNYFNQDRFAQAVVGWLLDPIAGPGGPGAAASPARAVPAGRSPEPAPAWVRAPRLRTRSIDLRVDRGAAVDTADAGPAVAAEPPVQDAPREVLPAHLRADLPAMSPVGVSATLRVRLSRKPIAKSLGTLGAESDVVAIPGRELTVLLIPKLNVKVKGTASDSFALPTGNGVSEVTFAVVPQQVGPVRVAVLVQDGAVPVGMLTIEAAAVARTAAAGSAQASVRAIVSTEDAPNLDDVLSLTIVAGERDGDTVFTYLVMAPREKLLNRYESPPMHDMEKYTVNLYREIAQKWADHGAGPDFMAELQNKGASLFDQLFPEPMRELMWEHRDSLRNMVLITDEAYLPWELVHLKPADGPRLQGSAFLGELGLVRWKFGTFPAGVLRARAGKVWALCPQYADPAYQLAGSLVEATFLEQRLGAKPAKGTPKAVSALLRRGGFDLLHFSGHGYTDPSDAAGAKILLAGKLVGGQVVQDYLSATDVAENAKLGDGPGVGPLVVLNACQTARGGWQLSSMGGFAEAFLDAGAAGYIAPLWSVGEAPALDFVEALYDSLLDGKTMSEATAAARDASRGAGDATWLAYAVYARPDARLVTT